MSAEILRRAAALMRERAEAATPGPWHVTEDVDTGERFVHDTRRTELAQVAEWSSGLGNPQHIASWHPAVALPVAQWLSFASQTWRDDMRCTSPIASDEPCDTCSICVQVWTQEYALIIARAYLGEQP